ncbi:MAG: energy transducer TonB [Verrucomicrobia bacterium]|nr:energy transducer TonB [Verrucomicrobiota bacterium]
MSRNLVIGLVLSLLLHAGFIFGGQILKAHPGPKQVKKEAPTVELMPIPPMEPDKPEDVPDPADKPDISDIVPPMQADLPSIVDSPFSQQMQAIPPQGLTKIGGGLSIPKGRPGGEKVFDIASLDQKPEARFQPKHVYPPELKHVGLKGEVTVGFIIDSSGGVRDAYIVSSTAREFEKAAKETVLKWKFRPGKKGGSAVNSRVVITLEFTPPKQN